MTILYLHYCAIYPPQVVLRRETKKMYLLMQQKTSCNSFAILYFPSVVMHSQKGVQQSKLNAVGIDPQQMRHLMYG